MRRLVLLAAGLTAMGLLAACGDIPQPFRHDGPASPLARPKMARGVAIAQPDGPDGGVLAQALVQALEDQDVPALVEDGPAFGHRIEGRVDDLGSTLDAFWTLRSPDGDVLAQTRQSVPKRLLAPDQTKALKRSALASAQVLALPLADPDSLPAAAPAMPTAHDTRPVVRLAPLQGLPGDGDKALAEAMRRALQRAGVVVKDDGALYVVQGHVSVTPGPAGSDMVSVAWVLTRAADKSEVANVGQSGAVPKGRLSQPWGPLARDIAEGGASGVVQAVRADDRAADRNRP